MSAIDLDIRESMIIKTIFKFPVDDEEGRVYAISAGCPRGSCLCNIYRVSKKKDFQSV